MPTNQAAPTADRGSNDQRQPAHAGVRRCVIATDWSHPAVTLSCLQILLAELAPHVPLELVFAVPDEPTQADGQRAAVVITQAGGVPADLSVRVESFAEAAQLPCSVAVVPEGDPDHTILQVARWCTHLGELRKAPPSDPGMRRSGPELSNRFARFAAAPSSPAPAPTPAEPTSSAAPMRPHVVYVGGGRALVTTTWGFSLHVPSRELSIAPALLSTGQFEPELARFLQRTIAAGDRVVDVGANIGVFTVLLGHLVGPSGHVYAYEPMPAAHTILRDNVMMNWLSPRVTVSDVAVSDSAGPLELRTSDQWIGLSSALTVDDEELTTGVTDPAAYTVTTRCVTLDEQFSGSDFPIAVVKVDVEGAEGRVFAGMRRLLDEGRVRCVVFECIGFRLKEEWPGFCARLRELAAAGWTLAVLAADGGAQPVGVEDIIEHAYLYHVAAFAPAA